MKKLLLILAIALVPLFAQDLVISNATELGAFRDQVNNGNTFGGKTIVLSNNITLTSDWIPIGGTFYGDGINSGGTTSFQGTFDGQGYTISGLSVDGGNLSFRSGTTIKDATIYYAGLFGYVLGGQIKNVNVIATKIKTSSQFSNYATSTAYAGGLVAYYSSGKTIDNCSVKADSIVAIPDLPTGYQGSSRTAIFSGGLVGYINIDAPYFVTTTINNSYTSGNVSAIFYGDEANSYAGGLVGGGGYTGAANLNTNIIITNSYTKGNVSITPLRPIYYNPNSNYNSYSCSGGLVGRMTNNKLTIANSYASGNVSVSAYAGNSAQSYSGGLVGYSGQPTTITNSYASGNILVVSNNSNPYPSTSSGFNVSAGGLVGLTNSTANITNSYASGNVSATHSGGGSSTVSYGGIFGYWFQGTNTSVYYKSEGASKAAGSGSPTGILAISSDNLKKQATFAGWDFNNVWVIDEDLSYPYLEVLLPFDNFEEVSIANQIYTGEQITPKPIIKLKNGIILIEGTNYELSYGANKDVGKGTIIITGKGKYATISGTISFNIVPKILTLTSITAQNKTYDGTTAATIIGSLSGIATGDNVSFVSTGTFADKNVGNSIPVSISVTLEGTSASNYSLTQPTNLTANITQKTLTITNATAQSKVYDGTTAATITGGTLSGIVTGDNVSFVSTGTFANKNVGNSIPISVFLEGTSASNYSLTQPTDLTANIVRKALTITNVTAQSKVYDGTTTATIIGGALSGIVTGDNVSLLNIIGNFATENAGSNSVYISGTLIGEQASNYGLVQLSLRANITPKPLTITNATVQNKVYDNTTTATVTGILEDAVAGDDVSFEGKFTTKNVPGGSIMFYLTGISANNYSLTQPTGLTAEITKKTITIYESNNSFRAALNKDYDGTATLNISAGSIKNAAYGIVNGENNSEINNISFVGTGTFTDKNAGYKQVSVSITLADAISANNYEIIQPKNLYGEIRRKTLTIVDVAAQDKVYDGTATAMVTGTLQGVVIGDDVSFVGKGTFESRNVGNSIKISNWASLAGAQSNNYSLEPSTNLYANITSKPLTIANAAAQNKIYDGTTRATITGIEGIVTGDILSISGTFASGNVGNDIEVYNVTITGTAARNYEFTPPVGLTANISAKTLPVNAIYNYYQHFYTGKPITTDFLVRDDYYKMLVNNTDYTLSFSDNINVGIGKVTAKGQGNYTGEATLDFTISPRNLNTISITNYIPVQTYTGEEIKPDASNIFLTHDSLLLEENKDYIISYGTNINAGTGKVIVDGIGNYTGTINQTFVIEPKTLLENAIQTISDQIYTGYNITPEIVVEDGGKILTNGDYNMPIFDNNINAGTATVTITGKGNYIGEAIGNFNINPKQLTDNMIEAIPAQQYANGNEIKPSVTVKNGSIILIEENDYSLAYSNNTNLGFASVSISGIGNYTGTASSSFEINISSPILSQVASTQISVRAVSYAILLENLSSNAMVELYNLQGKRLHLNYSENSKIMQIPVQTKGMYIVKVSVGSEKKIFRVVAR